MALSKVKKGGITDTAIKQGLPSSTVSGSAQLASAISGSLGSNASIIRSLTRDRISGSLGTNRSLIRTLTRVGVSGSFTAVSSSLAARITSEEGEAEGSVISSSAQIASDISGSITVASSSFSTRATQATASISAATSSISALKTDSGSFSTRATQATASIAALKTDSGSFSTRATQATASISFATSSISALKTDSGSFSSRTTTLEGSGTIQGVGTTDSPTFADLTATGTVTAQEFHTEFVSSSILYTSGSTRFGNSSDDIHQFTGSIHLTDSGSVSGSVFSTGSFGSAHIADKVGIGTTDPGAKLHLASTTEYIFGLENNNASNAPATMKFIKNGASPATNDQIGQIEFHGENDNNETEERARIWVGHRSIANGAEDAMMHFNVSDSGTVATRMAISGSNVGIGTASPGEKLTVWNSNISLGQRINSVTSYIGKGTETDGGNFGSNSNWIAFASDANDDWIAFGTHEGGESGGERVRIQPGGNVGINDSTPTDGKLVVDAGSGVNLSAAYFRQYHTTESDMEPTVSIYSDANNNRTARLKIAAHGNPEDATIWMVTRDNEWTFGAQHEGKFIIADNSKNVSSGERLVIDTSGNIGIGTTVPKTALHVQGASSSGLTTCGAMRFTGNNGASGNMQTIEWTDSDSRTEPAMSIGYLGESSGGQGWGSFFVMTTTGSATGAGIRFKVISTGDTYTNDGSVSSLSDKRAKKNIIDLEDGLSIVNQLKPKTFQYNGKTDLGVDDGKTRFGFIADDVLEVASQYVEIGSAKIDGAEVDDFKSLSTGRMIPMMVKSIQELSTANDELKARIEALENA